MTKQPKEGSKREEKRESPQKEAREQKTGKTPATR